MFPQNGNAVGGDQEPSRTRFGLVEELHEGGTMGVEPRGLGNGLDPVLNHVGPSQVALKTGVEPLTDIDDKAGGGGRGRPRLEGLTEEGQPHIFGLRL